MEDRETGAVGLWMFPIHIGSPLGTCACFANVQSSCQYLMFLLSNADIIDFIIKMLGPNFAPLQVASQQCAASIHCKEQDSHTLGVEGLHLSLMRKASWSI